MWVIKDICLLDSKAQKKNKSEFKDTISEDMFVKNFQFCDCLYSRLAPQWVYSLTEISGTFNST